MSLIDANGQFSSADTISADAYSENIIDTQAQSPTSSDRQVGPVYLNSLLSTGFTSLTSIKVVLRTSDTNDGTDLNGTVLDLVSFMQTEDLDAPRSLGSVQIPMNKALRYLQVWYDVDTPSGSGNLETWLGMEPIVESLNIQAETV